MKDGEEEEGGTAKGLERVRAAQLRLEMRDILSTHRNLELKVYHLLAAYQIDPRNL